MNYQFNKKSQEPQYIQLYHMIRSDIEHGIYPYGTKLPSKRIIADETEVSVITVEHAMTLLSDEGYIETRERSGNYVIYRENDFVSSGGNEIHETYRKDTMQDDMGHFSDRSEESIIVSRETLPLAVYAKTMRRVIAEYGDIMLEKSPNFGSVQLREAISKYLARSRGMKVETDQIIIGSGAEYLYGLIAQFFGEDHIFALENPSYDIIEKVYRANGIKCDLLKLGEDGIISSELEKTKATVLHITPFNSYPSGITAGASKKNEYIRWANLRNGYIIEDNYDSELTVSRRMEDTVFSMSNGKNVIYINTFSNTVASSVRIGYMILPKSMIESFTDKLGFYSCTVPAFEQYVLKELIDSGDFERHINRVRRNKRKEI